MRKFLFEIPAFGVKFSSFSASLLLACVGALLLTIWRARREKLNPETVVELAVWLMSGGFIGARLLYLVSHPQTVHGLLDVFKVWQGGIVFYGCIIGGLIGSCLYWVKHPFPFRPMADAVAPSLVLGSAIGRVGCFLNGCCFGAVSHVPWAVSYPVGSLPWARHVKAGLIPITALHSLPLHPTQLYSALDALLILALLTAYYPRRRRDGEVMALLMLTYPVARFLTEALRSDEPAVLAGLSMSQIISLVVFVSGLIFWRHLSSQPPGRYADRMERAATSVRPSDTTSPGFFSAPAKKRTAAR